MKENYRVLPLTKQTIYNRTMYIQYTKELFTNDIQEKQTNI